MTTQTGKTTTTTDRAQARLSSVRHELSSLDAQLRSAIQTLGRKLDDASERLDSGALVNSLGIVQNLGQEVDRLCALRQAKLDERQTLVWVLRADEVTS